MLLNAIAQIIIPSDVIPITEDSCILYENALYGTKN